MALTCSAKGCSAAATWSLLWNNPRLHTPERRKTWLACDTHRDYLAEFLRARRFLRDVERLEDHPDEPAHDLDQNARPQPRVDRYWEFDPARPEE
jgi:hypothetical protein